MEIKLSSIEAAKIIEGLKNGSIDLSQFEGFKTLVEGYNPPKEITDEEVTYYLDCLHRGWGYVPTPRKEMGTALLQDLNDEQLKKWQSGIEDGSIYKQLVRDAFFGLVAFKALGGTFEHVEADFSFMEALPPNIGESLG